MGTKFGAVLNEWRLDVRLGTVHRQPITGYVVFTPNGQVFTTKDAMPLIQRLDKERIAEPSERAAAYDRILGDVIITGKQ
jgi:hypothetical protein